MSTLRWYWLLIAASIVLPAATFGVVAVVSRTEALRDGRADVANRTAIMLEQARKVFETEELALARVDDQIRDKSWDQIASPATSAFLARLKAPLEQAVSIWVADAQGIVRAGSQAWDINVPIKEREFFTVQKERDAGTFVSGPFRGKATSMPSFAVSQRKSTRDGHFDGTIHIALSPAYFARFFAEVVPGTDHAALLMRADGQILARHPERDILAPVQSDRPLMQAIVAQPDGGGFQGVSTLEGSDREYAYRKVAGYPVYVVLGVDRASLLAHWHQNMLWSGAATAVASVLLLSLSLLALRGAQKERAALLALRRESAQREVAEQRVRDAQKMEAVGQLTGGIAHDFNNLLTAVLGSLELLRRRLPTDDPRVNRLLDNAVHGATRGAALTQRLLAFGRRQALNPEAVDVAGLVAGMADLLASSLGAVVQLETAFPPGLPPVFVDANQLELAILNLVVNARDAMPDGGRIMIAARAESHATGAERPRGFIVLSITDTGVGMDQETLARAMEPFFTTKGVGKGTGLGLSMVHGLAGQSGGWLSLRSRVNEGTTAELWLPMADAAQAAALKSGPAPASPVAKRRSVLLVDDDPLVLSSVAAMLEDMGHAVAPVASGQQALECLRGTPGIDLVIADQGMPGMTGLQLVAALHAFMPRMPVLLATGYAEVSAVSSSGLPVLAKPFDQAALAEALARL